MNQILLISISLNCSPFFRLQSLIEAHDTVAAKCYEMPLPVVNSDAPMMSSLMPADAVRMIGIQKKAEEPLVSEPGIYLTCDFAVLHTVFFTEYLFEHDDSILDGYLT